MLILAQPQSPGASPTDPLPPHNLQPPPPGLAKAHAQNIRLPLNLSTNCFHVMIEMNRVRPCSPLWNLPFLPSDFCAGTSCLLVEGRAIEEGFDFWEPVKTLVFESHTYPFVPPGPKDKVVDTLPARGLTQPAGRGAEGGSSALEPRPSSRGQPSARQLPARPSAGSATEAVSEAGDR